jgi:tetratricopeptide (TPR) repeat protein
LQPAERLQKKIPSSSWLVPALIAVATFIVFLPALQNGFVNWDDDKNLLNNPDYHGLGWKQLRWMFTTFHLGHYQPLSWLTFGLDYLLWGMDPFGYHLTSLVLHAANAALVYFVAARLFRTVVPLAAEFPLRIAAGFAALFFALHPLRVESVAWATERRDVLSGLFFLSTILCYLEAVTDRGKRYAFWLSAAIAFYACALLSKAIVMTLPLALLVLDAYPLRRLAFESKGWVGPEARKVLWEKTFFLLLAGVSAAVAVFAQLESEALRPLESHAVGFRLAQAFFGLAFYLWKTAIPFGLAPLYQAPLERNFWDWAFLASGAAVLSITVGLFVVRRRWPAGLAIWFYYGIMLAPALGITQSGPQLVADRYSYLSCLGWALLAGAGMLYAWGATNHGIVGKSAAVWVPGAAGAVLLALGFLTWRQTEVWRDSESLWTRTLQIDHNSNIAHDNLGMALADRGEFQAAIEHYRRAIEINPGYVNSYNNLGVALLAQGQLDGAVAQFRQAAAIGPGYIMAHSNLGIALARKGEMDEAVDEFRAALRLNPSYAVGHYNLGSALALRGDLEGALEEYRAAVRYDPEYANAHYRLGAILVRQGRPEEAIEHYRRALEIRPEFSAAQQALNEALSRAGPQSSK